MESSRGRGRQTVIIKKWNRGWKKETWMGWDGKKQEMGMGMGMERQREGRGRITF